MCSTEKIKVGVVSSVLLLIFTACFRYVFKARKLHLLHHGKLPPVFDMYPDLLNQNQCKPYKLNLAGKRLRNRSRVSCETVCIILSSSATFEDRAVKVYNLILNRRYEKICPFVLMDENAKIWKQNEHIPIISRASNTSWIGEKLYALTFNYEISGRGSKVGFQERVAEFTTLFALSCLPNFTYILLFDDDTIFSPSRFNNLLKSNSKLKIGKDVFAGRRYKNCNVLCGGAGMLFSRDVIKKMRREVDTFYQKYSRYYSKHVDVRLTRFVLEVLMIKPMHVNRFLNDPPSMLSENVNKSSQMVNHVDAITNAITIHHMPFSNRNAFHRIVTMFYSDFSNNNIINPVNKSKAVKVTSDL